MKYCLLGLLLLAQNLYGQIVLPGLIDIKTLKATPVRFGKKEHAELPTFFTSIRINDLRSDTVTAGYVKFGSAVKTFARLELEGGIPSAQAFVNRYFRTNAAADSFRLYILLRHFYLTQNCKMPSTGISLSLDDYRSKVFVTAQLVARRGNGNLYWLGKVDTVLTKNRWLVKVHDAMAEKGFVHLVQKAEDAVNEGRLVPLDEAGFDALAAAQQAPVDPFQDGVYASYEAFQKRQAAQLEAGFEQTKGGRFLRPQQLADTTSFQHCWGFVKEGVLYVRQENGFVSLQYNLGSWTGLGLDSYEVYKLPSFWSPLSFGIDMIDIANNGPTTTYKPYKLYRLNTQSGNLE